MLSTEETLVAEGLEVLSFTEWAVGSQVDRVFQYSDFHRLCREAQGPRAGAPGSGRVLGRILLCTETFSNGHTFPIA